MNSGAKNRVRVASATARTFLTATTVLCTGLAAPAMAQMLPGGGNGTGRWRAYNALPKSDRSSIPMASTL